MSDHNTISVKFVKACEKFSSVLSCAGESLINKWLRVLEVQIGLLATHDPPPPPPYMFTHTHTCIHALRSYYIQYMSLYRALLCMLTYYSPFDHTTKPINLQVASSQAFERPGDEARYKKLVSLLAIFLARPGSTRSQNYVQSPASKRLTWP